jgi:hypothetical protein
MEKWILNESSLGDILQLINEATVATALLAIFYQWHKLDVHYYLYLMTSEKTHLPMHDGGVNGYST